MGSRKLSSFTQGFLDYTEDLICPYNYRVWASLCAISGALRRRVWTMVSGRQNFPNLYVVLHGPPGVGKTTAIVAAREILASLVPDVFISPERITRWKFYEKLEEAKDNRVDLSANVFHKSSPISVFVPELEVFIEPGDRKWLADLADLYDCPSNFDYETKTQGSSKAENVCLALFMASTPESFQSVFTQEAFRMGLVSRFMIVWSQERITVDPFLETKPRAKLSEELKHDIKEISQMAGLMMWTPGAQALVRKWHSSGMEPKPPDPRLEYYNSRRLLHFTKTCICLAASKHQDLVITEEDANDAKNLLEETEQNLPKALSSNTSNDKAQAMKLAVQVVDNFNRKGAGPCPDSLVRQALHVSVKPQEMRYVIYELMNMGWIIKVPDSYPEGYTANQEFRSQWEA